MNKEMKKVISNSEKNSDIDSKKNEEGNKKTHPYNLKDRIAIEEFLFVAETSSIIISEIAPKRFSSIFEDVLTLISNRWQDRLLGYYNSNKRILYPDSDAIINRKIKIDQGVLDDLLIKRFQIDEIEYKENEGFDGDEQQDALFRVKYEEYIKNKYGSENIEYSILYKGTLLARHFLHKKVVTELQLLAKKCLSKLLLTSVVEYDSRLTNVILRLNSLHDIMIKPNNGIPPEIKFWRELILEESMKLLKILQAESVKMHTQRIRVLILNSLIKAAGITPKEQLEKERFIAEILDIDTNTVGSYFNDSVVKSFGIQDANCKKQIENAQITCELLKSNNRYPTKGDHIVDALINHLKLAGTPEYKDEK